MTTVEPKRNQTARHSLVLTLSLVASTSAVAQSANDFRLPAPSPSATTRPQGPVDADNPIVVLPRPGPSPAPSQSQSASPLPAPSLPTTLAAEPTQAPDRTTRVAPNRQPPRAADANRAASSLPSTVPELAGDGFAAPATQLDPAPGFGSAPITAGPGTPAIPSQTAPAWWWPYAAGLAGLVAVLFAFLWWRRRKDEGEPAIAFERPTVAPRVKPQDDPLPAIDPIPDPAFSPPPPRAASADVSILLEAKRLNATLVGTTLSYRLVLTNTGSSALSALAIEGDMIAAHASLPPERQVAQPSQRLELRHALSLLDPGESVEFDGDIRLPLAAITPIRAGDAALFIPLARFRVEAGAPGGLPLVVTQTFVVGELGNGGAAGLRPFRLDLGPRTYSRVSQRLVG